MPAPLLLFAIGNESRGDDAIAPTLLRKLYPWLKSQGIAEHFDLIEDFQLQVEHATDLVGRELTIFIDAGLDTPDPYSFFRIQANKNNTLFSHAISPEAVLSTYFKIYNQPPPSCYVLCIRGEQFELGTPLSFEAQQRIDLALECLQQLVLDRREAFWDSQAGKTPVLK
jgi:hydrogenase maturation protease